MIKRMRRLKLTPAYVLTFTVLAVAGTVAACGGGPTSPSGNTNLRLMLTDAPGDFQMVYICFDSVTAKPVNKPPQELSLQLENNCVDLLTLANDVIGFAAGAVEPGDYEYIHVNIDPSKSYVKVDDEEIHLRVPSNQVKILGGFNVDDQQLTTLTLDFDAEASVVPLGNDEFLLKPVIIKAGNTTSS